MTKTKRWAKRMPMIALYLAVLYKWTTPVAAVIGLVIGFFLVFGAWLMFVESFYDQE